MSATASLPLVCRGRLQPGALAGDVVIVTGAGGGIGLEAARSLLSLGATVVVAEIDEQRCAAAGRELAEEAGDARVMPVQTDVGDAESVRRLVAAVNARLGKIDAVINNATYSPAGLAVTETEIGAWDRSYAVNLRGPAMLARECIPGMVARGHGVFACVSSTGGPFLAPYEALKAAQVTLADSLDAELAGSGVVAFTIGPGLVATATAVAAIERIAPRLGMTVEEFWRTNHGAVLSVEPAGAGFAAAVAMAGSYAGQEISSTQALIDAGIAILDGESPAASAASAFDVAAAASACAQVRHTLEQQSAGWRQRSFFERQWMARDFKQRVGMPVERCVELLATMEKGFVERRGGAHGATLARLADFYGHLRDLAAGYVKDPAQREEQLAIAAAWKTEVDRLIASLPGA